MNVLSAAQISKLMSINDEYEKALYLVSILFADIKDKENKPYINHLIRVSISVNEPKTKVAALLHDTVEDIDGITFDDLKAFGFSNEALELVRLVTNDTNTQKENKLIAYHDYISSILDSGSLEAVKLKYADMLDNYNEERLNKLDEETRTRLINKYKNEIIRLNDYIEKEGK